MGLLRELVEMVSSFLPSHLRYFLAGHIGVAVGGMLVPDRQRNVGVVRSTFLYIWPCTSVLTTRRLPSVLTHIKRFYSLPLGITIVSHRSYGRLPAPPWLGVVLLRSGLPLCFVYLPLFRFTALCSDVLEVYRPVSVWMLLKKLRGR